MKEHGGTVDSSTVNLGEGSVICIHPWWESGMVEVESWAKKKKRLGSPPKSIPDHLGIVEIYKGFTPQKIENKLWGSLKYPCQILTGARSVAGQEWGQCVSLLYIDRFTISHSGLRYPPSMFFKGFVYLHRFTLSLKLQDERPVAIGVYTKFLLLPALPPSCRISLCRLLTLILVLWKGRQPF